MTQKLQNSINNGYTVEMGNYFSRGYDIMKQNMGGYIGFAVLGLIIAFVANLIPFLNILAGIVVTPCLFFGFHLVSYRISAKREIPPFNEFFNGFNHFSKIVVITLLIFVITLALFIPLILVFGIGAFWSVITASGMNSAETMRNAFAGLGGTMVILFLITMLAYLYLAVSLMFSSLIAVFHNEEVVDAMKLSWKVVNKNWLMWIVMLLALGIMLFIGALFCLVGLFFALPLFYCIMYAAFEDVCGVPETDGDHNDEISMIGAGLS
jgi:membrane-anchored glycerophosphoryl diester phosphodiesterase (GDPDase)